MHLASWAGADLPLAMDLIAGNDDVRPGAPGLLRRALAVLPAAVCGRPRVRADAGYFDGALARAAVDAGCDFAIAAKRNTSVWRAAAAIPETAWRDAHGMPGAQVAACDYAPAGWPPGTYTIVRRVKISAELISRDPRSRRRCRRGPRPGHRAGMPAGHYDMPPRLKRPVGSCGRRTVPVSSAGPNAPVPGTDPPLLAGAGCACFDSEDSVLRWRTRAPRG